MTKRPGSRQPTDAPHPEPAVLCSVPSELAHELIEPLRRHHVEAGVEIEVLEERRLRDRRSSRQRRGTDEGPPAGTEDRRKIRSSDGRRVGEQRAELVPIEAPAGLPRKAEPYAERILFFRRVPLTAERVEELEVARLVTRIQSNGNEDFAELYRLFFDRIYAYLRVLLRDSHEAEDATQQVFMRVFQALPDYELRDKPFQNWLFTVARNLAMTQLRKSGRMEVEEEGILNLRRDRTAAHEPEAPSLGWISDGDIVLFIERLPLTQRQIIALRYLMGMTHREIADILGRSEDDVKAQHHRAVKFLRERLAAIGRGPRPSRRRAGHSRVFRPAELLRHRRFALH
jgi:RNA polymerase sigma-70 factor, ECF subfamily